MRVFALNKNLKGCFLDHWQRAKRRGWTLTNKPSQQLFKNLNDDDDGQHHRFDKLYFRNLGDTVRTRTGPQRNTESRENI